MEFKGKIEILSAHIFSVGNLWLSLGKLQLSTLDLFAADCYYYYMGELGGHFLITLL